MSLTDDLTELEDNVATVPTDPPPHTVKPDWKRKGWSVTVGPDGAEVETDATDTKIVAADDWDGVLRHFGLNPAEFAIVDNSVRMSSWQQSKGLEDGSRDTITLYSYRARFERITDRLPEVDLDAIRKRVWKWKPLPRKTLGTGLGEPCTFYDGWADWQIGKEGVEITTQRILDHFEDAVRRVKELRKVGRNVTSAALWNMGDPTEGCDSNYASQLFSVELTRREQLNLALDLWLQGLATLAPLFEDVEFGSVLCNHGEWSRQGVGTKAVTSDSDNIGGYLADTVQKVLSGRPGFEHVRYSIPSSQMTMMTDMSGVPVALNHGHKMPGTKAELEWMQAQSLRMLREHGREPRLWMVAHRHHYSIVDHGPWHRIQHPAQDLGSKWYSDTSGKWSSPGGFTCLVGQHSQAGGLLKDGGRGFSDEYVILPRT